MSKNPCLLPDSALLALASDDPAGLWSALGKDQWEGRRGDAGEPAVFWVAKMSAVACLKAWADRWGSAGALERDAKGRSIAHWIASGRRYRAMDAMAWAIEQGASVDEPDEAGATALGLALALNKTELALAMAEAGCCDLNRACFAGLTPLELVVSLNFGTARVEPLIRAGAGDIERVGGPLRGVDAALARAANLNGASLELLESRELEATAARGAEAPRCAAL